MRSLIIPDIHGRTFWKSAINEVDNVDKIIFLGDYCDPYPFEDIYPKDAIENFKEILDFKDNHPEKVILLLGNHDLHYFSSTYASEGRGSRYSSYYASDIRQLFSDNHDKFILAYQITDENMKYVFSHAGIIKPWFETHKDILGPVLNIDIINQIYNKGDENMNIFGEVSMMRGGLYYHGGPTWADVQEHKKETPFDDIYQIFGHTLQIDGNPIITDTFACLDCRKIFILENNELKEYDSTAF